MNNSITENFGELLVGKIISEYPAFEKTEFVELLVAPLTKRYSWDGTGLKANRYPNSSTGWQKQRSVGYYKGHLYRLSHKTEWIQYTHNE